MQTLAILTVHLSLSSLNEKRKSIMQSREGQLEKCHYNESLHHSSWELLNDLIARACRCNCLLIVGKEYATKLGQKRA